MEPITTGWMMATLLSGWIGNRGDSLLCKGFNKLYKKINENIDEPANQDVQRAIRKAYLNATLLAVEHIQRQRNIFSLTNRAWENLDEIKNYIKDSAYIPASVLDSEYRDILFPIKGVTAQDRRLELIQNLKESIIKELESNRLFVESALKKCIYHGWEEGRKDMDFYNLICAFFTQELKDNPQLFRYIQTEYLDHIATDIDNVLTKIDSLQILMDSNFRDYEDLLVKGDELLVGQEELKEGQKKILTITEEFKNTLYETPEKIATLIANSINDKTITSRQITISEEYQNTLRILKKIDKEIISLNNQRRTIQNAILKVDKETKDVLKQNITDLSNRLIVLGKRKKKQETKLNEFISNVIDLAKQLRSSEDFNSERLKKARVLFIEGKYEELNKILNENEINKDIKLYKEYGEILAKELIIKAKSVAITKSSDWFKEACRLYRKAISISENYYTVYAFAFFLDKNRKDLKATGLFEKALDYASNDVEKINALYAITILQRHNFKYKKAKKSCLKGLDISRKKARESYSHLSNVTMFLVSLGNIQSNMKEYVEAIRSYKEALHINRKILEVNNQEVFFAEINIQTDLFSEVNPTPYLDESAVILLNLGVLEASRRNYDIAIKSLEEALVIYRRLEKMYNHKYSLKISSTLNELGRVYMKTRKDAKAEKYFLEALEILTILLDINRHENLITYGSYCLDLSWFYSFNIIDKQKVTLYAKRALDAFTPFISDVPGAKIGYDNAQEIIEYYESDSEI